MQRRHRRGTFQRECKYVTSAWYWRKGGGGGPSGTETEKERPQFLGKSQEDEGLDLDTVSLSFGLHFTATFPFLHSSFFQAISTSLHFSPLSN